MLTDSELKFPVDSARIVEALKLLQTKMMEEYEYNGSSTNADNLSSATFSFDESGRREEFAYWHQIYNSSAIFGLILNFGMLVYLLCKLRSNRWFTPGYCLMAMSAADILTLSHFLMNPIISSVSAAGWTSYWAESVFLCKLPIFIVHVASGYSAWTMTLLSLCSFVATHRPYRFQQTTTFRRPIKLLASFLVFCAIVQSWIPIFVVMDPVYKYCRESHLLGQEVGSALLLSDLVVNWLLPSLGVAVFSCKTIISNPSKIDCQRKRQQQQHLDGSDQREGGGIRNAIFKFFIQHPTEGGGCSATDSEAFILPQLNRSQALDQLKNSFQMSSAATVNDYDSSSFVTEDVNSITTISGRPLNSSVRLLNNNRPSDNSETSAAISAVSVLSSAALKRKQRRQTYKAKKFRDYLVLAGVKITMNVPLYSIRIINCLQTRPVEYSNPIVAALFPYIYLLYYLQFCFDALYIAMIIYNPQRKLRQFIS